MGMAPQNTIHASEENNMKEQRERATLFSRRGILTGSAMLLIGGISGRFSNHAYSMAGIRADKAPPLPWKWVKLDPLEAGRRAYRSYLENKG